MRHQVSGRKLGRKTAHRIAMFRNMVSSLIMHERIKTTLQKAKELRSIADKMITLGKKDTLDARRQVFNFIRNRIAVQKLFGEIAPVFKERQGGYTRIYRTGFRAGDKAQMAYIEYLKEDLVMNAVEAPKVDATATKAKAAKTPKAPKAPKTAKEIKEPKVAKKAKKAE